MPLGLATTWKEPMNLPRAKQKQNMPHGKYALSWRSPMTKPTTAELREWLENEIACASDPFDHHSEKDAVMLRALLDLLAEPVLPEGWRIVKDEHGVWLMDDFKMSVAGMLFWRDGRLSVNGNGNVDHASMRAWHLACADAIAKTEEEGNDDG